MRTYRARQRDRDARLVDPADAPSAFADNQDLNERVDQLVDERDRLWAQVVRLQERIRELERIDTVESLPSSVSSSSIGLSRAQRRRLEREQARRPRER